MTLLQLPMLLVGEVDVDAASAPCADIVLELVEGAGVGVAAHNEGAEIVERDEIDVARLLSDRCAAVGVDKVDAPETAVGLEVQQRPVVSDGRFREWLGREIEAHGRLCYGEVKAKVKRLVVGNFMCLKRQDLGVADA